MEEELMQELRFFPELPDDLEPYLEHIRTLEREIRKVRCTPDQSKYEVREGFITQSGLFIGGGNHEYGKTCALHGEESVIIPALQTLGKENLHEIFALGIMVHDTVIPQPCGNCRDVLASYFLNKDGCYNPDLFVLGIGPEKEGNTELAVARLKDYYFEDFKLHEKPVSADIRKAIKKAARAYRFAYDIYGTRDEHHPTGAATLTTKGKYTEVYPGAFVGDVAYHPLGAVGNAKAAAYADGAVDVEAMVIVADGMPHVPYRQRQYLVEISPDLEVYLVSLFSNEIWKTTPAEMLPNNFGPHNLGMTEDIETWKESVRKLVKQGG